MTVEARCRFCGIALDLEEPVGLLQRGDEYAHEACVLRGRAEPDEGPNPGWKILQWVAFGEMSPRMGGPPPSQ